MVRARHYLKNTLFSVFKHTRISRCGQLTCSLQGDATPNPVREWAQKHPGKASPSPLPVRPRQFKQRLKGQF